MRATLQVQGIVGFRLFSWRFLIQVTAFISVLCCQTLFFPQKAAASEASEPLQAPVVQDPESLILSARQNLLEHRYIDALTVLEQVEEYLADRDDVRLLLALRVSRGEAFSRLGRNRDGLAQFAAAIALADARGSQVGITDLGLRIRLELAQLLAELGSLTDARSMAWDAFQVAIRSASLDAVGSTLQSLFSFCAQQERSAGLFQLFVDVDRELLALDSYRLSARPPPEPIIDALEQSARGLASRREFVAASRLFQVILSLDLSRGADWRLVSDLSDLAWVSLQQRDLLSAHWALRWVERLAKEERSAELWANWSTLQELAGDPAAALLSVDAAVSNARVKGDEARVLALESRRSLLLEKLGDLPGALELSQQLAERYRSIADLNSAWSEELRAAELLFAVGRAEEAAVLLAALLSALKSDVTPAADVQVRMHLLSARLAERQGEAETARIALRSAGSLLFDLGRLDELAALVSSFGDLELRAGRLEAALPAFENAARFEQQLGLELEGWQALAGKARHAHAVGDRQQARQLLALALARAEWQEAQLPLQSFAPAELRLGGFLTSPDTDSLYEWLAELALDAGELEALTEVLLRRLSWRSPALDGAVAGASKLAEDVPQQASRLQGLQVLLDGERELIRRLRDRLRDEAVMPSSDPPELARQRLVGRLAAAMDREDRLLDDMQALLPSLSAQSTTGLGLADLQGSLAQGQLLLFSQMLNGTVVMVAVSNTDYQVHSVTDATEIEGELRSLWSEFGGASLGPRQRARLERWLVALSERFIAPLAPLLQASDTVFWFPSDELRALPLAALPLDGQALSERAGLIGLGGLRSLLTKRSSLQATYSELLVLPDPSGLEDPGTAALELLKRQLEVLRTGRSTLVEMGIGIAAAASTLPVVPVHQDRVYRRRLLENFPEVLLCHFRPLRKKEPLFELLSARLARGQALDEAFREVQRRVRRRRAEGLSSAAFMLWLK
ncbi:MAG: hypothetical protein CMP23_08540 [Rickettsiales bacterium]|nr:hypothetical protein [Rickettsiales bacterium]